MSRFKGFHNSTRSRALPFLVAAAQIGMLGTGPAHAEAPLAAGQGASGADTGQVEEIVVTAERRSEAAQSAPISLTAISSTTIEKFDIQDFADYAKLVPNLSFGLGTGAGGASFGQGIVGSSGFTIRGISGYQTTAFYIDDTPVPDSLNPRILDIDHIEVLRGPQGTLFGASSMGGLVRLITQPADMNTFSGSVDVQGYGASHASEPGGEGSIIVNLPLVEDVASLRLSGFGSYAPGYFTRTYDDPAALNVTGRTVSGPARTVDNIGAVTEGGFAATLRLVPTDDLVLTPSFRWQRTSNNGFPLADYSDSNLVQRRILNQPEGANDQFFFGAFTAAYTASFGRFVSSTSWLSREFDDREDGADANSVFLSPNKLLAAPALGDGHTHTFTEEDRFESDFDFPVQVIAGVFYQYARNKYINNILQPGLAAEGYGTNLVFNLDGTNNTTQLAGFFDFTYTPIEGLEIQAGGRQTRLTNYNATIQTGIFGVPPGQTAVTDNDFTPRFSVKYRFDAQTMIYATAAQGFRTGGANVPIGPACGGFGFSTTEQIPYGPDTLWSYEGGIKTSLLNNRLTINADYYHIDWSKIQQTEDLSNGAGGCFAALTLNLGSAQSDGGELEVTARATDDLTLHLAAGYEDARLTKVLPGTEYTVGEALSGVPKWTATASAEYNIPQSWGNYFVRGQYSYTGKSESYSEEATGLLRKSYSLTDVRLGANYDAYTLAVFAKNLFDTRTNLSDEVPVSALACSVSGVCRYRYYIGPPREVGVDFRYKFGGPSSEPVSEPAAYVPPAVQPPAPAPRSYLVFFDFNKSDLTPQATEIVDQAARNAAPAKVTQLTVTGHTDTVGSDAYNLRLSRRRAESVAAQLEKDGIPSSEIDIVAKGKRDLLVPTADGVREPQNRRVQIVYSGGPTS